MDRRWRIALLALTFTFLLIAGRRATEAGNAAVTPPAPPPEGTTIVLTSDASRIPAPGVVTVHAQLMRDGERFPFATLVRFSLEGPGAFDSGGTRRVTSKAGAAKTRIHVQGPGEIKIHGSCLAAGCGASVRVEGVAAN